MTATNMTSKSGTFAEAIASHNATVGNVLSEGKGRLTASEARALRNVQTQLQVILKQDEAGFRPEGGVVQKLSKKDRKALTELQGRVTKGLELPVDSKMTGVAVTVLGLTGLGAIAAQRTNAVSRFVAFATPHAVKAQDIATTAFASAKEAVSAQADRVSEFARPYVATVSSFASEKSSQLAEKATRSFQFISGKATQTSETLKAMPLSHQVGLGVAAIAVPTLAVLGFKGVKAVLQTRRETQRLAAQEELSSAQAALAKLGFFAKKADKEAAKARVAAAQNAVAQ
jgi:hypothetical protein